MSHSRLLILLTSASSLVLAATGALAQQANDQSVESVVVTGSLVVTNGFQAPTPVTAVTADSLRDTAPDLISGLQQLPQLGSSSGPTTPNLITQNGNTTVSAENLRGLGVGNTLVLLDGQRTQPSSGGGATDTSMFPQLLVKRVDIVTGGASAVYGSDAVAGVVNFVLDTDFVGLKAEAKGGVSTYGDAPLYGLAVAGGTTFDGGRGHILLSGDFSGQSGLDGTRRAWDNEGWDSFSNPNTAPGQPNYLLEEHVTTINGTNGGIITGPSSLNHIQFNNAGQPYNTPLGELSGNGTQEIGNTGVANGFDILAGNTNEHLFSRVSYDINDSITLFGQAAYGVNAVTYPVFTGPYLLTGNQFTIYSGNAYIPASIQAAMTSNGISAFTLGKIASDFGAMEAFSYNDTVATSAGLDAKLWGDWTLDTYGQYGYNLLHFGAYNDGVRENIYNAADAVVNPATGATECYSTLHGNPNNGCVPWDVFGSAPLTSAQKAYMTAEEDARSLVQQSTFSISARGTLLSDWAGDITGAVGFQYRADQGHVTVPPLASEIVSNAGIRGLPADLVGVAGGGTSINPEASAGSFDVKEGFGEVLIPLAKDMPFVEQLSLDTAYRFADYSEAGDAQTYKVGLNWQPFDEWRVRWSYSRDVRAPNITELFGGGTFAVGTVIDPFHNNTSVPNIYVYSGSNPDLKPEKALTQTAGLVYTSNAIPGLGASVDYYHIAIADSISALSDQQEINDCYDGDAALCSQIDRDAAGDITAIHANALNLQTLVTDGVDFEGNYDTPLFDGNLSLHLLGTYVGGQTTQSPDSAPVEGQVIHWISDFTAGYRQDEWSVIASERFIGSGHRETPPTTINDDDIPIAYYTALTFKYDTEGELWGNPEFYLTINNVFDQNPRITATNGGQGAAYDVTSALYDVVGRYFTFGVRAHL